MPSNRRNGDKDDDRTVDSDSHSVEEAVPAATAASSNTSNTSKKMPSFRVNKRIRQLTKISRQYDLDGDGILDEAEQAMRDRDVLGRGFLTNEEIYDIVQDQLRAKKSAGYLRTLVVGLICFVGLLALSSLGTSWASAMLAKDLTADDKGDIPVMRNRATNEIAGAQTVADTYELNELTDEEIEERRRLVQAEMEEDPHSHAHRRDLRACGKDKSKNCGDGKVTFDGSWIDERQFEKMESQCKQQKNVYIKLRKGDSSINQCMCSRGTSVVVKEKSGGKKKGKVKNKNKKDKTVVVVKKEREVIIEQDDGRVLHADCRGGKCFMGGTTLQGDLGDRCRLRADECGTHQGRRLVCDRDKNVRGSSSSWGTCVIPTERSTVFIERSGRAGPGEVCGTVVRDSCIDGYWCEPEDLDSMINARSAGGGVGLGTAGAQGALLIGPSGVVGGHQAYGSGVAQAARSVSKTGTCARTAGPGQTCWDDGMCGPGGRCDGLDLTGGTTVIKGSSGTIIVPGTGAVAGICR